MKRPTWLVVLPPTTIKVRCRHSLKNGHRNFLERKFIARLQTVVICNLDLFLPRPSTTNGGQLKEKFLSAGAVT